MFRIARLWRGALCAGLILVLFAGGTARAAEGKLLRWKLTPGDTLHFVITQDMNANVKAGEDAAPMKLTNTTSMESSWKVEAVDPKGVASVTQTIERMQMKLQSPQGVMLEYDSAAGKEPEGMATMLAPMMNAMVKKPFLHKMTARGEILEMKPPQGFVESINKLSGGGAGGLFSDDMMKQMSALGVFPEEPVTPGKTWSRKVTSKVPVLGSMTVESTFRYVGSEDRGGRTVEKIAVTMLMKLGEEKGQPGLTIKDVETDGTLLFDAAAGRLVQMQAKMKMKMSIAVGTMKIEQDMEMDQRMEPKPAETDAKK